MSRRHVWVPTAASLATLLAASLSQAGSTGNTELFMVQGGGAGTANGDYVSNGLNTSYRYFIEVPPGLARLEVDLFDADVGIGGAGEVAANRDRARGAFDTAVTYSLFDPAGVNRPVRFTTGDATQPAGSDNAWLSLFDGNGNTVLDQFGAAAYNNNNGTANWATNWIETDAGGGGATGGAIQIVAGQLRLGDNVAGAPMIEREVNLSATGLNLTQAFLTFNYTTSGNLENGDSMAVDVSSNGGTSWTNLPPTFTNDSTGTPTYDITAFIASNTRIRFTTNNQDATEFFFVDNVQISDGGGAITAGHWELRMDLSASGGDDIHAVGIRAHDGTSGASELNVYYDSQTSYGANPGAGASHNYTYFPYITSGCSASENDFDFDSSQPGTQGSVGYTSRTGVFAVNFADAALSADNVWNRNSFTGWTSDTNSTDYGIWTMTPSISPYGGGGNYAHVYVANFQAAANPPAANPTANAFRVYFPTDVGAAPVKAYLEQQIRYGGSGGNNGPNPPTAGMQSIFTVTVRVVNPTAQAITFSAANPVTATVPGPALPGPPSVVYGGRPGGGGTTLGPLVTQGTVTSEPAINGIAPNVVWNPGTVAANTTVILAYLVKVTPAAARVVVTGTTAANGTTARFVDETGNTTQARATYTLGPLCELAVTPGVVTPVVVTGLRTIKTADGVTVEWNTASEVGAAGFDLYRWDMGRSRWVKVNQRLIPALVGAPQGGRYRVLDPGGSKTGRQWYLLKETEVSGPGKTYGPFDTSAGEDDERRFVNGSDERRARKPGRALLDASAASNARAAMKKAAAPTPKVTAALKIGVNEAGLVFVPRETIAAHFGLSAASAASMLAAGRFKLTNQDRPVAWLAASNERGLLFYGEAIDSVYTRDNVYWLRRGSGDVIDQIATGKAPATGATAAFRDTTHAEKDLLPATIVATDPDSDYWFWDGLIAGDPAHGKKRFVVNATSLARGGAPLLRVKLSGATASGVENEHHVAVRLNGVSLGEEHWTGITAHTLTLPVNASLLLEGANDVEVEGLLDSGVGVSIVYVDSFDLSYSRRFAASGSALGFRGDGLPGVTVTDFADQGVVVLDVSDPQRPRRVKRVRVEGTGGNYRVTFAPATPKTSYFAASESGWRAPAWTEGDEPSDLKNRSGGADYVIVTTGELAASAEALATLRSNAGLSTLVVDIQDIYDEFSYGLQDPRAMQSFLRTAARRWSTPPRYVLIAGRGHVDYKNNLGVGGNLVPPLMVATPKGLFASDTHLGDVKGNDSIPEIAVGRIPVLSGDELEAYADKVEAYEQAQAPESARQLLLLADTPDASTDFGAASDQIATSLPEGYDASRLYLQPGVDIAGPREELFGALASGVDLVNYTGHGALDRLSAQGLLTSADAEALTNTQLPVLTALSCTINRFEVQGFAPLGEELVKRRGAGFAAVWAPTGLSVHAEATLLGKAFYSGIAAHPGARLGDAVNQAFRSYQSLGGFAWMPDIYSLLGDPALMLKEGVVVEPADDGGPPTPSTE